ncbi:unnamed protein product [Diplocarpon coronariae]
MSSRDRSSRGTYQAPREPRRSRAAEYPTQHGCSRHRRRAPLSSAGERRPRNRDGPAGRRLPSLPPLAPTPLPPPSPRELRGSYAARPAHVHTVAAAEGGRQVYRWLDVSDPPTAFEPRRVVRVRRSQIADSARAGAAVEQQDAERSPPAGRTGGRAGPWGPRSRVVLFAREGRVMAESRLASRGHGTGSCAGGPRSDVGGDGTVHRDTPRSRLGVATARTSTETAVGIWTPTLGPLNGTAGGAAYRRPSTSVVDSHVAAGVPKTLIYIVSTITWKFRGGLGDRGEEVAVVPNKGKDRTCEIHSRRKHDPAISPNHGNVTGVIDLGWHIDVDLAQIGGGRRGDRIAPLNNRRILPVVLQSRASLSLHDQENVVGLASTRAGSDMPYPTNRPPPIPKAREDCSSPPHPHPHPHPPRSPCNTRIQAMHGVGKGTGMVRSTDGQPSNIPYTAGERATLDVSHSLSDQRSFCRSRSRTTGTARQPRDIRATRHLRTRGPWRGRG